jgi:hypothetical protein
MRQFLFLLVFLPTLLQAQSHVFRLRALEKSIQDPKTFTGRNAVWKADSTTLIVVNYQEQVFKVVSADKTMSFAWTVEKDVKNHSPEEARGIWEYTCVDGYGTSCQVQLTLMKEGFQEDAIVVFFYKDLTVGYTAKLLVD